MGLIINRKNIFVFFALVGFLAVLQPAMGSSGSSGAGASSGSGAAAGGSAGSAGSGSLMSGPSAAGKGTTGAPGGGGGEDAGSVLDILSLQMTILISLLSPALVTFGRRIWG